MENQKTAWHDLCCYMMEVHNHRYREALEQEYKACIDEGLIWTDSELAKYMNSCPNPEFQSFLEETYQKYKQSPSYVSDEEMFMADEEKINNFLDKKQSEFNSRDIVYKNRANDVAYKAELRVALADYHKWQNRASDPNYNFGYTGVGSFEPKRTELSDDQIAWNDLKNMMMVSVNPRYLQFLTEVLKRIRKNGLIKNENGEDVSMASEEEFNRALSQTPLTYQDIMFALRCEDFEYLKEVKEAYADIVAWSKRINDVTFGTQISTASGPTMQG